MNRLLLVAHILAASVFVGNILATLAWKVALDRSCSERIAVAEMLRIALRLDKAVTVPSSITVTVTGLILAATPWFRGDFPIWLSLSLALWIVGALAAKFVLLPSLHRLIELADTEATFRSAAYCSRSADWNRIAATLALIPVVVTTLMVIKPVLKF